MVNHILVQNIRSRLEKGVSPEVIRSTILAAGGWTVADLDEAFASMGPSVGPAPVSTPPSLTPLHAAPLIPALDKNLSVPTFVPSAPNPEPGHKSLKKYLFWGVGVLLILGIVGTGVYAYMLGIGPFSTTIYSEDDLLSGILQKTSDIHQVTYRVSSAVSISPRDSGAVPFEINLPDNAAIFQKYQNDYTRARDINDILGILKYQKTYPATLEAVVAGKSSYYSSYKTSITDPGTKEKYQYGLTDGGKNFNLTVTFDTKQAISYIKSSFRTDRYSYYPATGTPITSQTVTFTKYSPSYLYLSQEPPKPLIATLGEYARYLPSELSASLSAGATADWDSSNWIFNVDATGDFGDLSYKINIDALKKDKDYFLKINNLPSFFSSDISTLKGQWIRLPGASTTPKDEASEFSYLADNIGNYEADYKKNRQEAGEFLKFAAKTADETGLIKFKGLPHKEKIGDNTYYKYDININKDKIVPYYQKLLSDAPPGNTMSEALLADTGQLEYLQSAEFDQVFDYLDKNTFITLWIDEKGYPAIVDYKMRIIPPADATALKDKQANLDFKLTLDNINNSVNIAVPSGVKDLSDVIGDSLKEARMKGNNAKIKSELSGLRYSAEIYYDKNRSYGVSTNSCNSGLFTDISSGMNEYTRTVNYPSGTTLVCRSTGGSYAISANLSTPESGQSFWCVDSKGSSRARSSAITGSSC
ncbi:hypothetical protein KW790_00210 [Candidatus Parcubacteria bacterium]|nr:hypothetical protein [Candidatus Parcubacteria bacterium]